MKIDVRPCMPAAREPLTATTPCARARKWEFRNLTVIRSQETTVGNTMRTGNIGVPIRLVVTCKQTLHTLPAQVLLQSMERSGMDYGVHYACTELRKSLFPQLCTHLRRRIATLH